MAGVCFCCSASESGDDRHPFLQGRIARDPALREELEAAERLGVSYKRFLGWEPVTHYVYEDGRLVSSQPEPEWDETERAWMIALETYRRDELCPLCGRPKQICQDPEAEFAFSVPPPTRCHVTTTLRRAQKTYMDGPHADHPDALLWGVALKTS